MDFATIQHLGESLLGNAVLLGAFAYFIYRLVDRRFTRLENKIDQHEERCHQRWTKNWSEHQEMGNEIAHIKGKLEGQHHET